ncbi:phosphoribosylformylglycinamidine synthase subunit PurS [Pseudothermotoga sp. U03pept]|uniref:phosphoribosylformylglycinamidine synthase subunit PurS n=1 Tax=Pseudothermotoga sp. U03pept TaxID=3447012 RepID=UPI003F09072A
MYRAVVQVTLKEGVLDPQGNAVRGALHHLGFHKVQEVKIGKIIEITLKADSKEEVEESAQKMCEKLLANPVIERYTILSVEELS